MVNPNLLYSSADLLNATTVTTGSIIGDYLNDEFNCLVEDDTGVLLAGKRHFLYTIDSLGGVRKINQAPYKHYTTSDAGSYVGYPTRPANANFENPVDIEGRLYFPVEDYRILEYDHGQLTEDIQPSAWAAAPALQQPLLGMTRVNGELWVVIGQASTVPRSATLLPGNTALLANDIASAKAEFFAGRRQPNGSWQWHGSIYQSATANKPRYIWWDRNAGFLYAANANQSAADGSQYRMLVSGVFNPLSYLFSSNVVLSTAVWTIETGLYTQQQPNITKTLRYGSGRMRVGTPTLVVKYRTATDDLSTGYSTLDTYTTTALAATGTAFPASQTFTGLRLQFVSAGTAANNDYAVLYNFQVVHGFYPTRYADITFTVDIDQGSMAPSGGMEQQNIGSIKAFIDSWETETEPATLTDILTNESFSVNLDSTKLVGVGAQRKLLVTCHEVR